VTQSILSVNNQKLIKKLHQKKYRIQHKLYIAEGIKVVKDSLKYGAQPFFITVCKELLKERLNFSSPVYLVDYHIMKNISGLESPEGLLAVFRIPESYFITTTELDEKILVLNEINDPGNAGTLIRSAHWFGFNTVIFTENTVDPYNFKVVQAAKGSLPAIKIIQASSIDLIEIFKKQCTTVYMAHVAGESCYNLNWNQKNEKTALVLGNESHGLNKAWLNSGFRLLNIPSRSVSSPDSLNVAVAGSILMSYIA